MSMSSRSRRLVPILVLVVACPLLFGLYEYQRLVNENLWLRKENLGLRDELAFLREGYESELARLRDSQALYLAQIELLQHQQASNNLRRPSEQELRMFLASDLTDSQPFVIGHYVCMNYASDLKRNAALAGWNISVVIVNYNSSRGIYGHVLNGAYLSDGRWAWIEPQKDLIAWSLETHLKEFLKVAWLKIIDLAVVW